MKSVLLPLQRPTPSLFHLLKKSGLELNSIHQECTHMVANHHQLLLLWRSSHQQTHLSIPTFMTGMVWTLTMLTYKLVPIPLNLTLSHGEPMTLKITLLELLPRIRSLLLVVLLQVNLSHYCTLTLQHPHHPHPQLHHLHHHPLPLPHLPHHHLQALHLLQLLAHLHHQHLLLHLHQLQTLLKTCRLNRPTGDRSIMIPGKLMLLSLVAKFHAKETSTIMLLELTGKN